MEIFFDTASEFRIYEIHFQSDSKRTVFVRRIIRQYDYCVSRLNVSDSILNLLSVVFVPFDCIPLNIYITSF